MTPLLTVSCRGGAEADSEIHFGNLTYGSFAEGAVTPLVLPLGKFLEQAGERPLVLVHGFRCEVSELLERFVSIAQAIEWNEGTPHGRYTSVVLFTWPAGVELPLALTTWWSFLKSQRRTLEAGRYLAYFLADFPAGAVSVQGHSLGCAVTLHAIRAYGARLREGILTAAACPNTWLDTQTMARGAQRWKVIHSKTDHVLKYLYRWANWGMRAMGQTGADPIAAYFATSRTVMLDGRIVPQLVQLDMTPCEHSQHWRKPGFAKFLVEG